MLLDSYTVTAVILESEPTGWYSPWEVARLAGVSGKQVGQWARYGYMKSTWALSAPRAYAYQDVAEAMVLHFLIEREVPYRSIRRAIAEASKKYGSRWPLSSAQLYIVADHPQRRGRKKTVVVDDYDVVAKHRVLGQLDLIQVRRDLERGGWAARENQELRYIQVDPGRHSGTPVIRGTRIPAEAVAVLATQPDGRVVLKGDYELSDEQINDAVAWYQTVSQYEDRPASRRN